MKNEYFNEREKRLFNYFSKKDDFYKGCYFGETNPIIDNKINKIEKMNVKNLKAQLKKTKDKDKKDELLELISLYEPKEKSKDLFVFKTAEPYRKDYSRYVYWCNPFEPINKGKLVTTQGWRKEEKFPQYY